MTTKKIAILTQPLGHNYGGIIQNYALQKVLKDLGNEPITIDRRGNRNISFLRSFLSQVKGFIYKNMLNKNMLTAADHQRIMKNNHQFLAKHIQRSPKIDSQEQLINYFQTQAFDAVIVGSDQTWRPKYSPDIYNFYLDFLEDNASIKKLAYASSFGTADWEYTEEQTQVCQKLAQQFHAISVREDTGVDLCREKLGVEAVHLLDPTLLLTAEDYSQLIDRPKTNKGLFTYVLDQSVEKQNFIQRVADTFELKQHTNQAIKFDPLVKRKITDYIIPPLEGWLQGFRNADFVVTDSFHGTVFSIIFNKPFIALVNKARGASRFESILGKLGLEHRLVYDVNEWDKNLLNEPIDYAQVNHQLNELKATSLSFLKQNL